MEDAESNPPDAREKTKSRGRQRIEIKKLEENNKSQVAFYKRRTGLFKKAEEISTLCGAEIAVIALSKTGRVYTSNNAEAVVDRFLGESSDHGDIVNDEEIDEEEQDSGGGFSLDQTEEDLSLIELLDYGMALEDLRDTAATRLEEINIMNSGSLLQWVTDQDVKKAEFLN
ncbi:Transcription factor, MADS-box [Corchorus capsularis]|uniref:Transcription factor, MADS-box n=1 Tax=Corchorus capsularis TaxID=210143 RepID=A0A1R3HJS6_COCAP|nr:Transcription factor, MADS-box [Corchorus capsularis]